MKEEEIKEVGSLKNIVKPNLKVELEGVDVVIVVVQLIRNIRRLANIECHRRGQSHM